MQKAYFISIFMLISIFLSIGFCATNERARMKKYYGWGFCVDVPDNITVNKKNPVEDFDLYYFHKFGQSEPLLFGYAGNHPSFGKIFKDKKQIELVRIADLDAKSVTWIDNNDLSYCEILVKLSNNDVSLPSYVHFWYQKLSDENKEIANNIIMSIKGEIQK